MESKKQKFAVLMLTLMIFLVLILVQLVFLVSFDNDKVDVKDDLENDYQRQLDAYMANQEVVQVNSNSSSSNDDDDDEQHDIDTPYFPDLPGTQIPDPEPETTNPENSEDESQNSVDFFRSLSETRDQSEVAPPPIPGQ